MLVWLGVSQQHRAQANDEKLLHMQNNAIVALPQLSDGLVRTCEAASEVD